jgi:metal-dependent amidase/aminoacylase/carboxypeptidase family protein
MFTFAFALHNSGYKKHQIIVKENTFTCAVNSMIIKLEGKLHAGEPETELIPFIIAEIIQVFNQKINNDVASKVLSIVHLYFYGRKSYGVSAGYGNSFTVRATSNAQQSIEST